MNHDRSNPTPTTASNADARVPDRPRQTTSKAALDIDGMTCAACAARIERTLAKKPGVAVARVNYATKVATIEFDPGAITTRDLIEAVDAAGYSAALPNAANTDQSSPLAPPIADSITIGRASVPTMANRLADTQSARTGETAPTLDQEPPGLRDRRALRNRMLVAAAFSIPLAIIAMSHGSIPAFNVPWINWVQLGLATPVVCWCGAGFFRSAWRSARHAGAGMDTLIALGSGTAYAYSLAATFFPDFFRVAAHAGHAVHVAAATTTPAPAPVYFEAAAIIILFILIGKFLEARATERTGDSIRELLSLQPQTACVERDNAEQRIPITALRIGDTVVIRPGERVPIDGVVLSGSSATDESMLTGESMPVDKSVGSQVLTGTMNTLGSLRVQTIKIGQETTLHRIVTLVREAQGGRAPIARFADRVGAVFVPIVLAIAAITFIAWYFLGGDDRTRIALITCVSVLIIACPCALGLATPTAIMVGTGRAAGRGILIRSAEALEAACRIRTIVLDKTGTITKGTPIVTDITPLAHLNAETILHLAASAERGSEHPLARAIVRAAHTRDIALVHAENFTAIPGGGIIAQLNSHRTISHANSSTITIGSAQLIHSRGIPTSAGDAEFARLAALGRTPMFIALDSTLVGVLAVADELRPESRDAVARLKSHGLAVIMASGDNEATARAVAAAVGIDHVHADMKPDDKAALIKSLQAAPFRTDSHPSRSHRRPLVAMLGDGINDAPALAQADVGFAVGSGTDAAIHSAGITLLRNDPRAAVEAIEISRATMRTIRQNLFCAFFYNVISIPIAAGVLYPATGWLLSPMLASAAMALSSVSVVTNSLRLRRAPTPRASFR
jgi:P-type Cu+ transporter